MGLSEQEGLCGQGNQNASDLSSSLTLSRLAAFAKTEGAAVRPAPIVLSSKQPCNSVVLEANFHVRCDNPL